MKLIALLIAGSCLSQMNVERFFGRDYVVATVEMAKLSNQIASVANEYNVDVDLVKCIVFPEIIRNSLLSGLVEEKVLELSYVQFGSNVVDFSIGKFQIKPSFASKIEELIESNAGLKKRYVKLLISQKNKRTQRIIRLARLKELVWQIRYVCCFIDYCQEKYKLKDLAKSEKIKFLATAYNVGIKELRSSIENKFEARSFPYGSNFNIEQVSYWEVSLDYYIKYCKPSKN